MRTTRFCLVLFASLIMIATRSRAQTQPAEGTSTLSDSRYHEAHVQTDDSCGSAFGAAFLWEQNSRNLEKAFDTMQWYIRHCYPKANPSQTWGAYQNSWDSNLYVPGVRDSIFDFVLFGLGLRNDDQWFCLGVPLLEVKYYYTPGGLDYRACRTIMRFLMDNPRCKWNYDADSTEYAGLLESQWNTWSDSARGYGVKFDSTIPSLHDIGLDTLLKFAAGSDVHYDLETSTIMLDAHVVENPFIGQASVAMTIGREAYIHFEVFDILGQKLAKAGYEGVFEPGSREVPLNMSSAPPGTYYLRIYTANNEVRTIKMVKEGSGR